MKKTIFIIISIIFNLSYSQNPGDLDPSFDLDGKVRINLGNSAFDVNNQTIQSDGKIVVVGKFQNGSATRGFIARITADGNLDSSFNTTGIIYNSSAQSFTNVNIQSSGKIIVTGYISNRVILIRYNLDGTIDTTFATNGTFDNNLGSSQQSTRLADFILLNDDSMIVLTTQNFVIAKLTSSGVLDTTFDSDGLLNFSLSIGTVHRCINLLKQADNKFLIYGVYYPTTNLSTKFNFIARLNSNGSLDTSFNLNGYRTLDSFEIGSAKLQNDGKIILSTTNSSQLNTYRITTNGNLDSSFDTDGLATITNTCEGNRTSKLWIQDDSKIVLFSKVNIVTTDINYDCIIARFNTNGSLDTSFDIDGKLTLSFHSLNDYITGINVFNNKMYISGNSFSDATTSKICIAKLNIDGSLDTSFNTTGKTAIYIENQSNDLPAMSILQNDGKLLVFGSSFSANNYYTTSDRTLSIAKINPDGSLDSSFSDDGKLLLNQQGEICDAKLLSNNQIIIVAENRFGGNSRLIKLNQDGSIDISFGTNGIATPLSTLPNISYRKIEILDDGKIMIAGSYTNSGTAYILLARLNSDGTLDTSFGSNGYTSSLGQDQAINGYSYLINNLIKLSDGKFIIGGSLDNAFDFYLYRVFVCKLNADGSVATSFSNNGLFTLDFPTNVVDHLYDLKLQNDGKLIGAAFGNDALSNQTFSLFKLDNNGFLDTTFGTNGIVQTNIGTTNATAFCLTISNNQDIYAGGRSLGSTSNDFTIAKYNQNGSLNNAFGTNGIVTTNFSNTSDTVTSIELPENSLIAIGNSTSEIYQTSDFALAKYYTNTLSNNNFNSENTFQFYPNPTSGTLFFNHFFSKCKLFSIDGKLIETVFSNDSIDLKQLSDGIYILHVYDEVGNFEIKKVLKSSGKL